MSRTVIRTVDPRSPASRAGIRPGETLLEVNGKPVVDVLDYKFYTYDPRLILTLQEPDGSRCTVHIRKEEGEDLGLEFETYLMDRARSCANNCIFCFVDQMPKGMRKSLYFKDDDARLSFLMGNYLTLTNLSQREVQRIIDLRISPINVSVHTTDRELRCRMLKNRRAGESIDIMERFARNHITMNCQIVSCPGVNDGPALDKTLRDLAELYPSVNSVSVVPVGVTKFREGLYPLRPYTREEADDLIRQVETFAEAHRARTGTRLVWCSDEFYLLAGRELPPEEYFEEFTQLDNGVGMLTLLSREFARGLDLMEPEEMEGATPFAIATGVSAAPFLEQLVARTGIPPFMLGLSWSSTERMSTQQADMMTSELTAIRRGLEPVVERICELWLALHGFDRRVTVDWEDINLQDLVEEARAELYREQAEELRLAREGKEG